MTLHNSVIPQLMPVSPSCNVCFHQTFNLTSCKQTNYVISSMKLLKEITTVYSGNKSMPILLDVQIIKLLAVRACGTHNNHYNVKG